jgi:ribosomal-protein-alanine N-acetyltransferase
MLRLELGNRAELARQLGAALPEDWPPGEYDEGAIQYFLEETEAKGEAGAGWLNWYAVTRQEPLLLAGCGGFLGPADAEGSVEIGYSVAEALRGQGLATEMVAALVQFAFEGGARRVLAHTTQANPASIAVLLNDGFYEDGKTEEGMLEFVRTDTVR